MKRLGIPVLVLVLFTLACSSFSGDTETPAEAAPTHTVPPPADTAAPPTTTPMPPTATLPAPTETPAPPTPTTAPEACDPDQVVENLYGDLSREQFVIFYSGVFAVGKGPVLTLSFWFIDYAVPLNPPNDEAALNNAGTALESALNAAKYLEDADACVGEAFVSINAIVVDADYNGWISFEVPTGVLPAEVNLSDPAFTAVMDEHLTLSYVRTTPPDPAGSAPAGACAWGAAREGLEGIFGPLSNGNTAFFFVRDDHGNNVWGYLDNNNVTLSNDYFEDYVGQILTEVTCLHPAPDNLIVHTVGDGVVLFSGRLPRAGIEARDLDQFVPFP